MKKNILTLLIIITLLSIGTLTSYSIDNTIKIGLVGAMTGSAADHGTRQSLGASFAIEKVNAAGGINGKMVELVVFDDKADPKEAANIANRFVSDPEILCVIGHANSSCTLAGAPVYNRGGLAHITTTSSSPAITDAGPYTFRLWVTDAYVARVDIESMVEAGYDKIAIIYENNDFGRGGYDVANRTLNSLGLKPIAVESYLLGETKDFSTIITKLQNAGAEAVYAVSDEIEIAAFLTQSKQYDYNPFFMCRGVYSPTVLRLAGDAAEGAIGAPLAFLADPGSELTDWTKEFMEHYNLEISDQYAPVAYEAARIILTAIKERGEDREAVKDYISNLKSWKGMLGEVSFDENGDAFLPLTHMMVKDGRFVPWSPETHKK